MAFIEVEPEERDMTRKQAQEWLACAIKTGGLPTALRKRSNRKMFLETIFTLAGLKINNEDVMFRLLSIRRMDNEDNLL